MANMTDAMEQAILDLLFLNTNFANIGDATGLVGSTTAGSFYISLHTANPGEAGNQTTSEATYSGYARVAVARSGSGWSRTGSIISNDAEIPFPISGGTTNVITHFGIGTAASGTGVLLLYAPLDDPRTIEAGATPKFPAGTLEVEAL